jgi:hypothetical protein
MHDRRRVERHNEAHNENKETARNGEKGFSTNIHKLIVPVARQCGTHDNEENSNKGSLHAQQKCVTCR